MNRLNIFILKFKPLFKSIRILFSWKNSPSDDVTGVNLLKVLEQAHKDWTHAKYYFNCVTDPDLIDHAIFYMGETEKKYTYLLKRAREVGLNTDFYLINE